MLQLLTTLQLLVARTVDRRNDKGATMVEYGLLVALIAVVVGVAAATLGTQIAALFTTVGGSL